ncbi:MAG: response regulator [Sphingomonadales bacterium]
MSYFNLQGVTVLLVEDCPFTRSLLMDCLGILNAGDILIAQDGSEAIEVLQNGTNIDLVLTGWEMFPVNGLSLLRWMRSHEKHSIASTLALMMTAYDDKEHAQEVMISGANELLIKPFTIKSLSEKLMNVMMLNKTFAYTTKKLNQRHHGGEKFGEKVSKEQVVLNS